MQSSVRSIGGIRSSYRREIIGPSFQLLSNWCSMACAGCGIRVSPPVGHDVAAIPETQLSNAITNLRLVKDAMDSIGFDYGLVEQSGGEPSHHPQIVDAVGAVFEDSVHKIITNGLPSKSIYDYLRRRKDQVCLVMSVDHHEIAFNRVRLDCMLRSDPHRAVRTHNAILENLDLFARSGVPLVISTIISRYNILQYLDFIAWLEERYPRQVHDGMVVPIPVSLVSFGNPAVGRLNPSADQVDAFEEAIHSSTLITVSRARSWLFKQLVGHYRNKQRFFEAGEPLEQICLRPSRSACEVFRHIISFNFQDEEIIRPPDEALFQGYACGVKVLGNIGYTLGPQVEHRLPLFEDRPSNMVSSQRYFRVDQIGEYITRRDAVASDREMIQMGDQVGYFGDLRRGMCMLDDFDGVWWPFNVYLKGIVDEATLGEHWSLFRNRRFVEKLRPIRESRAHAVDASLAVLGSQDER
jgi:hypothetical protein